MNLADVEAGFGRAIDAARRRSWLVDRIWVAGERYTGAMGGRLAAAISYYSFFAAYSLGVLAYALVGRLLGPPTEGGAVSTINSYLETNLPWVAPTARDVGPNLAVVASAALLLSGVGWIESLRSSLRAIWCLDEHPGHWLLRRFVDLGVLVGLGVLLGLSLTITGGIDRLVAHSGSETGGLIAVVIAPVLEFFVNLALASATLTGVSRIRLSPRRLVPAVLIIAVGIQVLNSLGRIAIEHAQHRPAYAAVAGAVGLLVYLYVLNQLILFGGAFAATSESGTATDLGHGAAGIGRPPTARSG